MLSIAGANFTVDLDNIFADSIDITADADGANDGFDIPSITTLVPSEIPSNDPKPKFENEVVSVK